MKESNHVRSEKDKQLLKRQLLKHIMDKIGILKKEIKKIEETEKQSNWTMLRST